MILSKKSYADWRQIQDEFVDYKTSLGPWSAQGVIDFFRDDFPKSPWPFSEAQIRAFMISSDETIATSDMASLGSYQAHDDKQRVWYPTFGKVELAILAVLILGLFFKIFILNR